MSVTAIALGIAFVIFDLLIISFVVSEILDKKNDKLREIISKKHKILHDLKIHIFKNGVGT